MIKVHQRRRQRDRRTDGRTTYHNTALCRASRGKKLIFMSNLLLIFYYTLQSLLPKMFAGYITWLNYCDAVLYRCF